MRKSDGTLSANTVWKIADIPTGGGGYCTGPHIHSSGRQAIGTDTAGCYIRDPGDAKWTTVFNTAFMSAADWAPSATTTGSSTNWFRFAPSDKNRFYAAFNGYVFKVAIDPLKKLTDAGALTITRFNLAAKYIMGGAGWNRWFGLGCGIQVHPTDENTVLFGTNNDGCYYTTDGGATVTSITIPAGSGLVVGTNVISAEVGRERYMVWIDQGNPLYCYIFVQGSGLYRSTTGVSGTFSLVTGSPTAGPTSASCIAGDANGVLWITGDERIGTGNGGLWGIARGASTFTSYGNPIGGANYPWHVAIDPFDATGASVMLMREQIGAYTTDLWTTPHVINPVGATGGECPWHVPSAPKMAGGMAFDPSVQNRVLIGEGFGPMITTAYKTAAPQLLDYSKGEEGKIDNGFAVQPTTGKALLASWDLLTTPITSLTSYTNYPDHGPVEFRNVQIGACNDWSIDDENFCVRASGTGGPTGGYSTQGGVDGSWHEFAGGAASALPSTTNTYGYAGNTGPAGCIAVGNKNDIVYCPSNRNYASESSDGGETWNAVLLNGSIDYYTNAAYYYLPRYIVSADKERPGWFAMLVAINIPGTSNPTSPYGGLWVRPGSGQAWVQVLTGNINGTGSGVDTTQETPAQLRHVLGQPNEMLYTSHDVSHPDNFPNDPLWWIVTDGTALGTTKTKITGVTAVKSFGFGKALPGQSRPAVYFYGKVNGVNGWWVTFDWFTTFTQISDGNPNGYTNGAAVQTANGSGIGADPTTFGLSYCTINGKGSVFATAQDVAHAT